MRGKLFEDRGDLTGANCPGGKLSGYPNVISLRHTVLTYKVCKLPAALTLLNFLYHFLYTWRN